MQLYKYEQVWLEAIRAAEQRRVLVVGPTGSGKTVVAAHMIRKFVREGRRVLFMAHRQELVRQCVKRLIGAGVPLAKIGVIWGGQRASDEDRALLVERTEATVQVASVQTLARRNLPPADVVFVDEAHHSAADSYKRILAGYQGSKLYGLTATPCRLDGKPLGDLFDVIAQGPSAETLIAERRLSRPRIFSVPPELRPLLKGVRIRGGDFDKGDLERASSGRKLIGSIVEHWAKYGKGLPTVVYAVSHKHGERVAKALRNSKATVEVLSDSTQSTDRLSMIDRLARGELEVIVNCQVLTEGWDCPAARCCIMARPTRSLALWLQILGRFMRPGNKQPVVLDHAGNALAHGYPWEERGWSLTQKVNGSRPHGAVKEKTCPECGNALWIGQRVCSECGHEFWSGDPPEEVNAELRELDGVWRKEAAQLYDSGVTRAAEIARVVNVANCTVARYLNSVGRKPQRNSDALKQHVLDEYDLGDTSPTSLSRKTGAERTSVALWLRQSGRTIKDPRWRRTERQKAIEMFDAGVKSGAEIARRLDVSQATVHWWLNKSGRYSPAIEDLSRTASVLQKYDSGLTSGAQIDRELGLGRGSANSVLRRNNRTPVNPRAHVFDTKLRAIEMYHSGVGSTTIAKLLGVSCGSVLNWVSKSSEAVRMKPIREIRRPPKPLR